MWLCYTVPWMQFTVYDQGSGEQHGIWAGAVDKLGAVCLAGQQVGGQSACDCTMLSVRSSIVWAMLNRQCLSLEIALNVLA